MTQLRHSGSGGLRFSVSQQILFRNAFHSYPTFKRVSGSVYHFVIGMRETGVGVL